MSTFIQVLRGHKAWLFGVLAAIAVLSVTIVTVTYSAAHAAAAEAHASSAVAAAQASVPDSLRHDQATYRNTLSDRFTAAQQAAEEEARAAAEAEAAAAAQAAAEAQAAADAAAQAVDDSPGAGESTGGVDSGVVPPTGGWCPEPNIPHYSEDGSPFWCEPDWMCAKRDDDGVCYMWLL